jgi:hypothetical protein
MTQSPTLARESVFNRLGQPEDIAPLAVNGEERRRAGSKGRRRNGRLLLPNPPESG